MPYFPAFYHLLLTHYYQEKIIENNIDLSSIRKITDILKLPLLTKQDLFNDNITKKYEFNNYGLNDKNII